MGVWYGVTERFEDFLQSYMPEVKVVHLSVMCAIFFTIQLSTSRIMAACRLGFDEVYYLYVCLPISYG